MTSLKNLREQVTEALALRILDGTFVAEQPMPTEPELMELTGVSRTTLRSAIQSLQAKGMVSVAPSRGTWVRPRRYWNLMDAEVIEWRMSLGVTADLIREIYEMRECFEPRASYLAAERRTEADGARILAAVDLMDASRHADSVAAAEADLEFHLAVLASCGNDVIASLGSMMSTILRQSFYIAREKKALSTDDVRLHREVAMAILNRDSSAAQTATHELLARSKQVQIESAESLDRANRIARSIKNYRGT